MCDVYLPYMRYSQLVGWGIVIYAVAFLAWTGFLTYGIVEGYLPIGLNIAVLVAVASIAGRALRLPRWSDIVPYSIGWAIIVLLLDAVFAVPFAGWEIYYDWHVWAGYILVVVVPLFAPRFTSWENRLQAL